MHSDQITRHFRLSEFICPCPDECSTEIKLGLVENLQAVRNAVNADYRWKRLDRGEFTMRISSGIRCEAYNAAKDGSETSSHLTGEAADVVIPDNLYRYFLLKHAPTFFERLGLYPGHLHVDISMEKPRPTYFIGD